MKTYSIYSLRLAVLALILIGSFGISTYAKEKKAVSPTSNAISKTKEVAVKSEKPSGKRKKKVQMCQECGKPETKCECEGHN